MCAGGSLAGPPLQILTHLIRLRTLLLSLPDHSKVEATHCVSRTLQRVLSRPV